MQTIRTDEINGVWTFLMSIDWSDPWLRVLIGLHILILTITILTRHRSNIQASLFFVLLLLVYFSEHINKLGARHWKYFSREQYFDSKGLFISFVFSAPLLINCLIMVANWTYQSANLLVCVKQKQLKRSRTKEVPDENVVGKSKDE
ncbi:Transmembrane protein 18 [Nymphon striatum]|nr:Transmembrane protein 18 [Nymphon striatum]